MKEAKYEMQVPASQPASHTAETGDLLSTSLSSKGIQEKDSGHS